MIEQRSFRAWCVALSVVFGLIAVACFAGPDQWFSAHSVRVFRDLTHIPWPITGTLFAAVPALMIRPRLRLAAWFTAFLLSAAAVATLWLFTLFGDAVINVIIMLLVLLVPPGLLFGVRCCVELGWRYRADRS